MRLTPVCLAAGALLLFGCSHESKTTVAPPALAVAHIDAPPAPYCARSPELAAIELEGLKSRLMVTALSCDARDRYNAFVERYREALAADEKTLTAYFRRNYGRTGQAEQDNYITALANAQSQIGTQEGVTFCGHNVTRFDEVQALGSTADLFHYAEAKPVDQPYVFALCR